MPALGNGDRSQFNYERQPDGRDMSKHWCGKCHGNPACGQVKGDPGKLAGWKEQKRVEKLRAEYPLVAEFADELGVDFGV